MPPGHTPIAFSVTGAIAPSLAQAWGFNRRSFFDDFTNINSTIDRDNTKAAGFKWYANNKWPNATVPPGGNWVDYNTTPAASIVSNTSSILTLTNDAGIFGQGLNTCCHADNAEGFIGTAFSGGFCIEFAAAFTPRTPVGSTIAVWSVPVEFLTGATGTFIELDYLEWLSNAGRCNIIRWNGITPTSNSKVGTTGSPDFEAYNVWSAAFVPMALNGGTGKYQHAFNDSHIAAADTTWTSGQTYSIGDDHQYCIIIGAGTDSFALNLDYVAVWQA